MALQKWLDKVEEEETLLPELEIVDPHHHLWAGSTRQMSQKHLNCYGARSMLNEKYMMEELKNDAQQIHGHRVTGTIYVECGSFYELSAEKHLMSVGETKQVGVLAASHGLVEGILSSIDLTLDKKVLQDTLKEHRKASFFFKGVRSNLAWDEDPGIMSTSVGRKGHPSLTRDHCTDPRFIRGAQILADYGLVLDIYVYFHQIPYVLELAKAVPKLTIVLDHVGGPLGIQGYKNKKDQVYTEWKRNMEALSTCSNVYG